MTNPQETMYNEVFISYSRRNLDFAKKLVQALYDSGHKNIWFDQEDIPLASDWWDDIKRGIESAENFVFILTPDSAKSEVCADEINHAIESGKRIIPILHIPVVGDDFKEVHAEIKKINWIYMQESDNFEERIKQLNETFKADLAHKRFHTRILTRAREWSNNEKSAAYLLSSGELEEAEAWLIQAGAKTPGPIELQRDYILASNQAAKRQNRTRIAVLSFIIVLLLGIVAYLVTPLIQEAYAKSQAKGEMILIPAGSMRFGTDDVEEIEYGAIPEQEMTLPAFYVDKYEVSNAQYKLCVRYGNCTIPLDQIEFNDPEKQDFPVAYVTLFQANNYCHWLGLRLLNEVEWERAARGVDGSQELPPEDSINMPPQGDYEPTKGLQAVDSNPESTSPDGVYNMVGNVWEWTSSYAYEGFGDPYEPDNYWDGSLDSFQGTLFYATRGGGWSNNIAYISQYNPNFATDVREDIGFRCGSDAE